MSTDQFSNLPSATIMSTQSQYLRTKTISDLIGHVNATPNTDLYIAGVPLGYAPAGSIFGSALIEGACRNEVNASDADCGALLWISTSNDNNPANVILTRSLTIPALSTVPLVVNATSNVTHTFITDENLYLVLILRNTVMINPGPVSYTSVNGKLYYMLDSL